MIVPLPGYRVPMREEQSRKVVVLEPEETKQIMQVQHCVGAALRAADSCR